jgi:cell division protein FtsZ
MRNGGVAILGNAAAEGENRAQRAIEEALNSPLLNDNDIRGAKWILININSATGEHEFTMDEVEVIQNYLLRQAGEDTDVILGMGYDNTLGSKIGITLIATGFEHKDPFARPLPKKEEPKKEEKIIMVLGQAEDLKPVVSTTEIPVALEKELKVMEEALKPIAAEDYLMPKLVEDPMDFGFPIAQAPVIDMTDLKENEPPIIHFELQSPPKEIAGKASGKASTTTVDNMSTVGKMSIAGKNESIHSLQQTPSLRTTENKEKENELTLINKDNSGTSQVSAPSGGYLARPSNIYAETKTEEITSTTSAEKPVSSDHAASSEQDELLDLQMQLVEREDIPAVDMPLAHQAQSPLFPEVEDSAMQDETEEQQRRAAERLHKLRNLSFNVNAADPNNEFETVPAYIRRNMELHTGKSPVENFYSNYEVKTDDKNQTHISTITTFLDGEKPD